MNWSTPLDRRQRAKALRVFKDDLTEHPRVYEAVVRIDQDSLASGFLAPAGDVDDILQKYSPVCTARDRARGKNFDGVICQRGFHTRHGSYRQCLSSCTRPTKAAWTTDTQSKMIR